MKVLLFSIASILLLVVFMYFAWVLLLVWVRRPSTKMLEKLLQKKRYSVATRVASQALWFPSALTLYQDRAVAEELSDQAVVVFEMLSKARPGLKGEEDVRSKLMTLCSWIESGKRLDSPGDKNAFERLRHEYESSVISYKREYSSAVPKSGTH